MKIPVYYVTYSDLDVVSLVEHPAIEEDFLMFSKNPHLHLSYDEEKHIVFGPVMVPDKKIYRESPDGKPYFVVFTKEIIEQMVFNAAKKNKLSFSLEHSGQDVNSIYMVTSFLSSDTVRPASYEALPNGTWFIGLKIEDDQIWQDIKDGKFSGFSIEALCNIDLQQPDPLDEAINNILE